MTTSLVIGIISDTHGVLPAKVFELFRDVDRIIHAGDIGDKRILSDLEQIAPVSAVHGNMDRNELLMELKERLDFNLCGFKFIVTHFPPGDYDSNRKTIRISGHTHQPLIFEQDGSIFINPGSATQPRGSQQPSVARLVISEEGVAHADILYF